MLKRLPCLYRGYFGLLIVVMKEVFQSNKCKLVPAPSFVSFSLISFPLKYKTSSCAYTFCFWQKKESLGEVLELLEKVRLIDC